MANEIPICTRCEQYPCECEIHKLRTDSELPKLRRVVTTKTKGMLKIRYVPRIVISTEKRTDG